MYGGRYFRKNKKRGIIFTYDALISVFLLSFFIFSLLIYFSQEGAESIYAHIAEKKNALLARDIIYTLEEMKFHYLPETYQNKILLAISTDKEILYNKSIAEILVLLWSKGNTSVIYDIINYLYPGFKDINISIITSSQRFTIYSTSNYSSDHVGVIYSFVSGYEERKQPLGYVSKAFATKIKKRNTIVFPISPQGASNLGGVLTINKSFFFGGNKENITSAVLYLSLHAGDPEIDILQIKLNNIELSEEIVWVWEVPVSTGYGLFGYVNITPYVFNGWNNLTLKFRNPWFNAHIHPGSRIEITYEDDKFYKSTKNVIEKIYYEDVFSEEYRGRGTGVWATLEYRIPLNADLNNAIFHLALKGIEDAGWWWSWDDWRWYNWDVRVYVNGVLIDEIIDPTYNISKYYDIANFSYPGTNYILIYANTYGNSFLGDEYTHLYSSPLLDPDNSTYVMLNYTLSSPISEYGKIDVTLTDIIGGVSENPKIYSILLDNYTILSSFLHIAQIFSYTLTVQSWVEGSSSIFDIFSSSFPRGIPSTIYIDKSYLSPGNINYIKMEDECSGCDYLPESLFEYTLLIPSHVGYGDVFSTREESVNDAIDRLKNVLGKYVNATEIRNETATIGNIPYLYGPVRLEVSVW